MAQEPEEALDPLEREASFWLFTAIPSGLVSIVIHLALLIGLGLYAMVSHFGASALSIEVVQVDPSLEEDLLDETSADIELPAASPLPEAALNEPLWDQASLESAPALEDIELDPLDGSKPASSLAAGSGAAALFTTGAPGGRGRVGGGLANRMQRRRQALALGATPDSENAVEMALEWIVRHQRSNGGWSFDHRSGKHRCAHCPCGNPGRHGAALNGATAIALLPLLGAGHTPAEGQYRQEVAKGLYYLIEAQKPDGSLMDPGGNMYSHGLAALALCEALAMLQQADEYREADEPASLKIRRSPPAFRIEPLRQAAQRATVFIEKAQHAGGGWRYAPGQPGDTSIVGWQMMALKSAHLAELDVNPYTVQGAVAFLDQVSNDRLGSCYGYTGGAGNADVPKGASIGATTPIGLLCRMYTGWGRDNLGIEVGAERIARHARPNQGLYFYYYATQVMHHYGGAPWREWNAWMRDHLVRTQSRKGAEAGSWRLGGSHDDAGRLYCTAMAAMTLEIYYRYSPIYGDEAVAQAAYDEISPIIEP